MYQSTSMRLPTLGSAPQQMDQGTEYQTLLAFTFHGGQNTHCSLEYYPQIPFGFCSIVL